MKDSFIIFTEYKEQFDMLTDEQAGVLIKAIFCFTTDEEPPEMDAITKMAFSFIRAALERADGRYQKRIEANKENGKLGGRPRKESEEKTKTETQNNPKNPSDIWVSEEKTQKPNGYFENPPEPEREHDNEPDKEYMCIKGVWGENEVTVPDGTQTQKKPEKARFKKPTVEEVRSYCKERGNSVDPEMFVDFYESKGWKVGREPMKDWRAAVRTWEKERKNQVNSPPINGIKARYEAEKDAKGAEFDRMMKESGYDYEE